MKKYTREYGKNLYKEEFNSGIHINDVGNKSFLEYCEYYRDYYKEREVTHLRMYLYNVLENGTLELEDSFYWDCLKAPICYINRKDNETIDTSLT